MEKSIDIAADNFVRLHKKNFLDLNHIKDGYGSVAGFLSAEGQPTGDRGGKQIEIKSWHHKDGWTDTVEWFEDTYQIGCYRLPSEERVTPQDHTSQLDFCADFDWCLDRIKELRDKGYYDISLSEVSEGEYVSEIKIEDYIEEWVESDMSDDPQTLADAEGHWFCRKYFDTDSDHGPCSGYEIEELGITIYTYHEDPTRISIHRGS